MLNIANKRLATVKQVADAYPAFTQSSLRWLIFNEHSNGFDQCIRRIGRKILIDLDYFEKWIEQGGNKK
ncbi:MAG: DNA-binding protein [Gammaproteobacteria bacterium]|nr:DNA-binding protein [Gammaproteobacteria bacterium]